MSKSATDALTRRVWQALLDLLIRSAPVRTASLARRGLTPNDSRALFSLDPRTGRSMRSLADDWQPRKIDLDTDAGWDEDQRWTLARVRTLIGRMFHITVSIATVWETLRRAGYTPQQPISRAVERDEQAIAHFKRYQWPAVKGSRAGWARGSVSPTSPASR